jgi:hypothetical protein
MKKLTKWLVEQEYVKSEDSDLVVTLVNYLACAVGGGFNQAWPYSSKASAYVAEMFRNR